MLLKSYILTASLLAFLFACSKRKEPNKENQDFLDDVVNNDVILDENGEVQELKGFSANTNILSQGSDLSDGENSGSSASSSERQETLKNLHEENPKLFTYIEPDGIDADYSEPVMVTATYLTLLEERGKIGTEICPSLTYQEEEVEFSDFFDSVNVCGDYAFKICIRLSISSLEDSSSEQAFSYMLSPTLNIKIPCAAEIFENTTGVLAVSQSSSEANVADLQINVGPLVSEMFLSNDSSCETGEWEAYSALKESWSLDWADADSETIVYAKFKDLLLGESSDCAPLTTITRTELVANKNASNAAENAEESEEEEVEEVVVADTTAPTSTSISISSGSAYSTSSSVALTLGATEASSMYITNTSGCASGGSWETYATSKVWTLGQSNAVATVYVKYKDEADNESSCINDTILHDGTAPTDPGSFDDGTSSNVSEASFSWAASTDSNSISDYEVAIGTSAGASDVYDWTSVGDVTSVTVTGLSLTDSTTYYGSVRATDTAGQVSSEVQGDGFTAYQVERLGRSISSGEGHNCAIFLNGSVKCWGDNTYGQLGVGNTTDVTTASEAVAVNLGLGRTAKMLALSRQSTCVILDNDDLKCWGANSDGQLGQGNTSSVGSSSSTEIADLTPVNLGTGRSAKSIVGGYGSFCAVLDNNTAKCWGSNSGKVSGQAGRSATAKIGDSANELANLAAIDFGSGRTAKQISIDQYSACALLDNSSVKCWGGNSSGQLGLGNATSTDSPSSAIIFATGRTPIQIISAHTSSCALLDNFTVKCWGESGAALAQPSVSGDIGKTNVNEIANLTAIDLGSGNTASQIQGVYESEGPRARYCALLKGTDEGKLKCWGRSDSGALGQGNTDLIGDDDDELGSTSAIDLGTGRTVKSFSMGLYHSCAVLDNDSVKCWGGNYNYAIGLGESNTSHRGDATDEMGDDLPAVLDL